jgi:hypothetical protein
VVERRAQGQGRRLLFDIDFKGLSESEVVQKTGFSLASLAVKEITSRPTQMEVKMALQNNPGLLLSKKGSLYMVDIMRQSARQDMKLARLANMRALACWLALMTPAWSAYRH